MTESQSEDRPAARLTPELRDLLSQPVLARLATVDVATLQPHVVPVWFEWDGESVWISSYSNTRKVRELRRHAKCSIVVDVAGGDGNPTGAVIFEGEAELVRGPRPWLEEKITRLYTRYLGAEGVLAPAPQEWLHDPHNLLIKLTPTSILTWK